MYPGRTVRTECLWRDPMPGTVFAGWREHGPRVTPDATRDQPQHAPHRRLIEFITSASPFNTYLWGLIYVQ
jgi:hypothetical protein